MPLNILRLNEPTPRPNERITFIKPDPHATARDQQIAEAYLERLAAQCRPIMTAHHLSVTTLEEFPPNREFLGRNFNAGECIQLVLRSRAGQWLPLRQVGMVMMHELAHCVHMNHSRAFWAVRNMYAEELKQLWGKGYSGDGLWGKSNSLLTGLSSSNPVNIGAGGPESLCGGTFRSRGRRGRKRKQKEVLTTAEQNRRRVVRKFGSSGTQLGEDEAIRAGLEKGSRSKPAPRVAKSKRGRELRAAAALKRFESAKREAEAKAEEVEEEMKQEEEDEDEDEFDKDDDDSNTGVEAKDAEGHTLHDAEGRSYIQVCGDAPIKEEEDTEVKRELDELRLLDIPLASPAEHEDNERNEVDAEHEEPEPAPSEPAPTPPPIPAAINTKPKSSHPTIRIGAVTHAPQIWPGQPSLPPMSVANSEPPRDDVKTGTVACPVCSNFEGDEPAVAWHVQSHFD